MDKLESLLDTTSTLLEHNQILEARQTLENADETVQIANNYLKDIDVATNNLSNDLGIFSEEATNRLTEAYSRLQRGISRLNDLINNLNQIRMNLSTQYNQMEELTHTELSLFINKESAFLGDTVTVFGNLKGDNLPLPNKKIDLLMNERPITSVETESDGSYVSEITVPFEYIDTMTFIMSYKPTGKDTETLLASKSQPVIIDTTFYPTRLEVETPEKVYPGLPFTISGEVVPYNRTERDMKVLIDDTELFHTTISGRFHFEIDMPDDSVLGNRDLNIVIGPRGLYSGTLESCNIIVSTMPITIDTQIPAVIILPQDIHFTGIVNTELGPAADMPVKFNFMDSSSEINTNSDGSFSRHMKLHAIPDDAASPANPFVVYSKSSNSAYDLSPIGVHTIDILVIPSVPWAETSQVHKQVITINPISIGLILAALTLLPIILYRNNRQRKTSQCLASSEKKTESPFIAPSIDVRPKTNGIRGQILSAYRIGLTAVENTTDRIMTPDITLREFLTMASLPSTTTSNQFNELTTLAENTLYSAYIPDRDMAIRAEELAVNIEGELRHVIT